MHQRPFLIPIIITLGVVAIFFVFMRIDNTPKPVPLNDTSTISQSDWQLITDPHGSYTIRIPADFTVEENGTYSRLLMRKKTDPEQRSTNFIYLSTILKGKEGEEGSIYNYNASDFANLVTMQPGGTQTFHSTSYKRIDDTMIGGYGAKVFVSENPWEFPTGTKEYRYIVETEPVKYLFGAYVEGMEPLFTKTMVDQILATVVATPDAVAAVPIPTASETKTFTNQQAGITFKYPAGWQEGTGQSFEHGDLFSLLMVGQTQRTQTELYDGARFAVMKPVQTSEETVAWMKKTYESDPSIDPERPPRYGKQTFGTVTHDTVTVCGLGCFTYYHTKQNGQMYGFLLFATGPNETAYQQVFATIMASVQYTQ